MSSSKKSKKVQKKVLIVKEKKPELSVAPDLVVKRRSKDRSSHVIGQENFNNQGAFYAFHESLLNEVSKKRRQANSEKKIRKPKLPIKSEAEMPKEVVQTEPVRVEPAKIEPIEESKPVLPIINIPEPVLKKEDSDPVPETKIVMETTPVDDFIPISASIPSVDDHVVELLVVQSCYWELSRRREVRKQSVVLKSQRRRNERRLHRPNILARRRPKNAKSYETIELPIPEEGEVVVPEVPAEPMATTKREDQFALYQVNDFEFPYDDDFMNYGSPNDPASLVDVSDQVDFSSSPVHNQSYAEIMQEDPFLSSHLVSCATNPTAKTTSTDLAALFSSSSNNTKIDLTWPFEGDDTFDVMNSTINEALKIDITDVEDWLNLTTNEVLPEEKEIRSAV